MPIIDVAFDDAKVKDEEIQTLSLAVQKIVSEATSLEDVFVYANSARIKVKIAPSEFFNRFSAQTIPDADKPFVDFKRRITDWKRESRFTQPINLTLIPMTWTFGVGS